MGSLVWRSFASGALLDIRVPLTASATYLLALLILSRLPKPSFAHSRPFVLLAAAHNLLLSLASLIMYIGAISAIITITNAQSLSDTICTRSPDSLPEELQFWLYIFYASKFYELLDTPILLLRNRPLTLLHVWHHASVMFETRAWLMYNVTVGIYGMLFNTFVHIFMYAYYAAALLKLPFPKRWITVTQIIQFLTSFAFLIPWTILNLQRTCTGAFGLLISGMINGSYLLLFVRFYRKTYRSREKKGKRE